MLSDYPLHPILATKDLAAAKTWYRQKLGWEPTVDEPIVAAYNVGNSMFSIYETPSAGTAKNTVANWNVPDLSKMMEQLRANGVTFEDYDVGEYTTVDGVLGDPDMGFYNAWFKDPDGNTWGLLQFPGATGGVDAMLAATDLDRARRWYSEHLGYEPVSEMAGQVLNYTSGGAGFSVYRTEFGGTAKNTVAGWRVTDLRSEVDALRGRGVRFEDYDFGDVKTVDGVLVDTDGSLDAWFADSEGNILGIVQDSDRSASDGASSAP